MAVRLIRYGVTETDSSIIDHNLIINRELPNQHTMESISGLLMSLDEKYIKPQDGIPITDLGFNVATQEGLLTLQEDVRNRMTVIDSDLKSSISRITAVEDFLSNLYQDGSSGVPEDATINFAYRNGFREEFITQNGDIDFFLINSFITDSQHIKIYRDGELLTPNIDYIEMSDNHIQFLEPLESNIYLSFICESVSTVMSPLHEEILSIENQSVFTLKNAILPGTDSLSIFAQGLRLERDTDYKEVDVVTIELLRSPFPPGTKIIFRQEGMQSSGQVLYKGNDYQQDTWSLNFIATEGQQIFNLSEVYIPGTNMITVTVQGLIMWVGDSFDYIEKDEKTIEFNYPLSGGDRVTVTCIAAIYSWHEKFVSLVNQSIYQLHNIYFTGRNDIIVYENGLQLFADDDYIEVNSRTIKILEPPSSGSKITVYKRR